MAGYPVSIAPSGIRGGQMDLQVSRSPDGLGFEATQECDRFVMTAADGSSRTLPGGKTGFVAKGSVPAGLYVLRAEGPGYQAMRKVVMP